MNLNESENYIISSYVLYKRNIEGLGALCLLIDSAINVDNL